MFDATLPILRWAIDVYCFSTLLLGLGCLVNLVVKQPARRIQTARWTLALVALVSVAAALPGWTRIQLNWIPITATESPANDGGEMRSPPSIATNTQSSDVVSENSTLPEPINRSEPDRVSSPTPTATKTEWLQGLAIVFLGCVAVKLTLLALGRWIVTRLIQTSRMAGSEAMRQLCEFAGKSAAGRVVVRVTESLSQPVAMGLRSPHILMPPDIESKSRLRRLTLAHEWEHIRRGDLWVLALVRWLDVILFAHPLFWRLSSSMQYDQELLADQAAASTASPIEYAEMLVRRSQGAERGLLLSGQFVAMVSAHRLRGRVEALLDASNDYEQHAPRRWSAALAVALCVVAAALTLLTVSGQAEPVRQLISLRRLTVEPQARTLISQRVALDDSLIVEVVGLRRHPCDGGAAWDLGGNLIPGVGQVLPASRFPPEVIVRVRSCDGRHSEWKPDTRVARLLDSDESEPFAGEGAQDGQLYAIRLPDQSSGLVLPLTKTNWTTRSLSTCADYMGGGGFQYDLCTDTNDLVVSVTHQPTDDQLQLLALDHDGERHTPSMLTSSDGELTAVFDRLKPRDARCFYVQTRPQLQLSLRHLPMAPGQAAQAPVIASHQTITNRDG